MTAYIMKDAYVFFFVTKGNSNAEKKIASAAVIAWASCRTNPPLNATKRKRE